MFHDMLEKIRSDSLTLQIVGTRFPELLKIQTKFGGSV